jgi:hypothetical protein
MVITHGALTDLALVPQVEDSGPKKTPSRPTPIVLPLALALVGNNQVVQPAGQIEARFRLKNTETVDNTYLDFVGVNCNGTTEAKLILPSTWPYFPPESWCNSAASSEEAFASPPSSQTLSNGAAVPSQEAFYNKVKELKYDNDDAYRAATRRKPLADRQPVRVSQFRNFWLQMDRLAGFWDTSKDNVSYAPETEEEAAARKACWSRKSRPQITSSASSLTAPTLNDPAGPNRGASTSNNLGSDASALEEAPLVYTGHRHANGEAQPAMMREDTVRTFLEPIFFAFGCALQRPTPRTAPKLRLGTTKLDADHSGRIYRVPEDRKRARSGEVDGPLMALFCSGQLDFETGNNSIQLAARELLALLSLAQERNREGRTERLAGEGQWWAQPPTRDMMFVKAIGEPLVPDVETESDARKKERQKKLAKRTPSATWEPKVTYQKVGKAYDTEWDTVSLRFHLNSRSTVCVFVFIERQVC